MPVNLRSGPGTGFATLGLLPPGTPLAATGESASSDGFLWRRFRLADGQVGWVRAADLAVSSQVKESFREKEPTSSNWGAVTEDGKAFADQLTTVESALRDWYAKNA